MKLLMILVAALFFIPSQEGGVDASKPLDAELTPASSSSIAPSSTAECLQDVLDAPDDATGTIKGKAKSPWFKRKVGVIFIQEVKGKKFAPPKKNPVMDQRNLVYVPHILPILVGSTVDFPNTDEVRHNVYSTKKSVKTFNLGTYDSSVVKNVTFDKVGVVSLLCNVHAEMNAHIVICQNPYFSMTNKKDGTFEIKNVPPGTYKLGIFHEKVRLKGDGPEVTVVAGKTAEVELSKKIFKKKR